MDAHCQEKPTYDECCSTVQCEAEIENVDEHNIHNVDNIEHIDDSGEHKQHKYFYSSACDRHSCVFLVLYLYFVE